MVTNIIFVKEFNSRYDDFVRMLLKKKGRNYNVMMESFKDLINFVEENYDKVYCLLEENLCDLLNILKLARYYNLNINEANFLELSSIYEEKCRKRLKKC